MVLRRLIAWLALGAMGAVGVAAAIGWWRDARIEPLPLAMGATLAEIQAGFGPRLVALEAGGWSHAHVARPHRVTLALPTGPYEMPITRYTALDFFDRRLQRVLTSPHDETLSLREARLLARDLATAFGRRGWDVHRAPLPDNLWPDQERRQGARRPTRDLAYFRKEPIVVGLVLKLHHWRDDPEAPGARVPPGLAFLAWPFGGGRADADGWLVDMDIVAIDRSPPDHGTLLRFAQFVRTHGRGRPWTWERQRSR